MRRRSTAASTAGCRRPQPKSAEGLPGNPWKPFLLAPSRISSRQSVGFLLSWVMRPAKAGLLRIIPTGAATIAVCLPLSGQTTASTPQALVARFYTLCVKHHVAGLPLKAKARKALRPLLSEDLRRQIGDGEACQADFIRQFPDPPPPVNPRAPQVIYKPPFVDCCLFTSTPDGTPTSFTLGTTKVLRDGRYQVVVNFFLRDSMGGIKWRDAAIVKRESDRFVIDNVVFDADRKPAGYLPQPFSFRGCQGPRWVGGQ